ncbi:hypothetical protein ACFLX5_03895 [Chloroflexota bacterium]
MKVLIVDDNDILHKGKYEAEAVVILFDWGYRVVYREQGIQEYCTDLEKLLARPDVTNGQLRAIRAWLEGRTDESKDDRW